MTDWIKSEVGQCWFIICNGDTPIPKAVVEEVNGVVTKTREKTHTEYGPADISIMEKNAKARQLISNALSMEDGSKESLFPTAKLMWEASKSMNEGMEDLKKTRIFNLTQDLFSLRQLPKESIDQYHARYALLTNQLLFLG